MKAPNRDQHVRENRMAGYRIDWTQECRPTEGASVPRTRWGPGGVIVAETDSELREVLESSSCVAVVGIKDLETADAYRIPQYMQAHGYRMLPVNPKLDSVLGHPAVSSLTDIDEPVDIVNLFRATDHIPDHVDEILTMESPPKVVWMQLGIHNGEAAARLRGAGIRVVQDRCIMVEHKRLLGKNAA